MSKGLKILLPIFACLILSYLVFVITHFYAIAYRPYFDLFMPFPLLEFNSKYQLNGLGILGNMIYWFIALWFYVSAISNRLQFRHAIGYSFIIIISYSIILYIAIVFTRFFIPHASTNFNIVPI